MDQKIEKPVTPIKKPEKLKKIFSLKTVVLGLLIGFVAIGAFFWKQIDSLSSRLDSLTHQSEVKDTLEKGIQDQIKGLETSLQTLQHQSKDHPGVDSAIVENLQQKLAKVTKEQKLSQLVIAWNFLKQKVKSGLPYHEEWLTLKPLLQESGIDVSLGIGLEKVAEVGLKKPEIKIQSPDQQPPTISPPSDHPPTEDWVSWLRSMVKIEKIGTASPTEDSNKKLSSDEILQRVQHLLERGDFSTAVQFVESQNKENLVGTGLEDWLIEAHQYRTIESDLDKIGGEVRIKFLEVTSDMSSKGEK